MTATQAPAALVHTRDMPRHLRRRTASARANDAARKPRGPEIYDLVVAQGLRALLRFGPALPKRTAVPAPELYPFDWLFPAAWACAEPEVLNCLNR